MDRLLAITFETSEEYMSVYMNKSIFWSEHRFYLVDVVVIFLIYAIDKLTLTFFMSIPLMYKIFTFLPNKTAYLNSKELLHVVRS